MSNLRNPAHSKSTSSYNVENSVEKDQECSAENSSKSVSTDLQDKDFPFTSTEEFQILSDLECAVCLQTYVHPVELPCSHIFCFLCVKGVANQSKRCALCRQEIPVEYFNNPSIVRKEDLLRSNCYEDGHQWFYEGRNGWWQYDERTSDEMENHYQKGSKTFELLIAGFLYVIDLDHMLQYRRNDPTRRRHIKRDSVNTPKKGVAGLKVLSEPPQRPPTQGGVISNSNTTNSSPQSDSDSNVNLFSPSSVDPNIFPNEQVEVADDSLEIDELESQLRDVAISESSSLSH